MNPVLLIIAGPNGSGKTTITTRLRQDSWSEGVEYLNPDDIAKERFGDWNAPAAVLDAARWTEQRREELLAIRSGIAFETVFSTPEKVDFILRAKDAGYFTRVFFVGTADPSINAARIANRIMEGGHSVPIDKIISRYTRSMGNLTPAIEIADRLYIYDNSIDAQDAQLCARTESGLLRKIYCELPEWVSDALAGVEKHPQFTDARAR